MVTNLVLVNWKVLRLLKRQITRLQELLLFPLFTLGIPGSAVASILVGAFTMNGLQVGPTLFRNQSELMYGIMVGLIFCNIIMWVEGTYLQKVFAKIAKVPQPVLVTALTLFCVAGCYAVSNQRMPSVV